MRRVAQILSILLYPMLIPTWAMGLLCWGIHHYSMPLPEVYVWIAIVGTFVLTCCIPFSAILLLIRQKAITDVYLYDAKERRVPYMYSLFASGCWCYFLHSTLQMPEIVLAMAIASTTVLLCVMVITHWWKISAHLAFMGTLVGSVIGYSWHTGLNPLWLIILLLALAILLMIARLYLKQHTPAQVVCGFALGFILTFLPALFI